MVSKKTPSFPKIQKLVQVPSAKAGEFMEVPWLSKQLRFKGTLVNNGMDAKWFPLDVIKLRVTIVSEFLTGTTSMNKRRRVKLMGMRRAPLVRRVLRRRNSSAERSSFASLSRKQLAMQSSSRRRFML